MANLEEFIKLIEAADEELKSIENKTKETKDKLDQLTQEKYDRVRDYFNGFTSIIDIYKLDKLDKLFIQIPGYIIKLHPYKDSNFEIIPELGVYLDNGLGDGPNRSSWMRWVLLDSNYKTTVKSIKESPTILRLINNLVDNFEDIEPLLTANIKDAIRERMADKIAIAEQELINAEEELASK